MPPGPPRVLGDIEDRADCERLVRAFYGRALVDPIIGWIFVDVARLDLEAHVPVIASFWETVLLGSRSYTGSAFRPHAALHERVRLRSGHFERWLALWRATVDELFAGERAELAKVHASRVAHAFYKRLHAPVEPIEPSPAAAVLTVTQHGPMPASDRELPAPSGPMRSPALAARLGARTRPLPAGGAVSPGSRSGRPPA